MQICDALHDLVPFPQFKKREKHLWRSVNFSKVDLLKLTFLHRCFSRFLNCVNGTKSRNASHVCKNESNPALLAFVNSLPQFSKHCFLNEKVLNGKYYF